MFNSLLFSIFFFSNLSLFFQYTFFAGISQPLLHFCFTIQAAVLQHTHSLCSFICIKLFKINEAVCMQDVNSFFFSLLPVIRGKGTENGLQCQKYKSAYCKDNGIICKGSNFIKISYLLSIGVCFEKEKN